MKLLLMKLSMFVALIALSVVVDAATNSPAYMAKTAVSGTSDLPLDAQFAISGALGKQTTSYHAVEATGGYRLENPKQALSASFLPSGVAIQTGSARWGLALNAYGYGSDLSAVSIVAPQAESNRVEYRRGRLTEWYVNGPLGLQQGFTLASRPGTESDKPLTLALALSGELKAEVDQGGSSLTLRREGGAVALQYRGLSAYDAAGRQLHAWLEKAPVSVQNKQDAAETILLVRVDDAGAKYPVVIDPFIQQAKLTASDGAANDQFGWSVAISGDTVVVGAVADNSFRGSAYVFVKPGSGWANATEAAKLTASDVTTPEQFGQAVAISGDTVVVGQFATSLSPGSAYVFVKPGSGWADATETAKLTASDGAANDQFGFSVAISGDTVVVGARFDDDRGSAYVFVKPGSGWADATETAKLTASDGAENDSFGQSVAISGDTVVVGAFQDVTGTGGDAFSHGSAYVFVKPGSGWGNATEAAKLTASDAAAGDQFGHSVAVSGDTVVVGAVGDNSLQGSAYVFVKPGSGWGNANETAKLTASDAAAGDQFGHSVAVSGDTMVVGAWANSSFQGSAYVFGQPPPVATTVTVAATDSAAAEAGPDPGVFTVTRTGDTTNALTVNFTVGGTAASGTDYDAIGTSVLIPGGASSETITITPIADTLNEASETVILTLASGTGYSIGDPSTATVTIANYTGGLLRGSLKQVNFGGNVPVGSTVNKSLVVQNGSTTASLVVKINSPTPNPPFSLVSGGGTVVIVPGGSHTVTLRFAPTTTGKTSGSLLINSTDPAKSSATVSLTGASKK